MKLTMIKILLCVCALLSLSGCRHRDFCYHHEEHSPVAVTIIKADYLRAWEIAHAADPYRDWRSDWPSHMPMAYDDLLPGIPEGLRVVVYPHDGSERYAVNMDAHGGELQFQAEGWHSMLLYNNDTEYIVFEGQESYTSSTATTRTRNRSTYNGNRYYAPMRTDERTVTPPDVIYSAYVEAHVVQRTVPGEHTVAEVTLQPRVFTYVVHYGFDAGFEYVKQARGALAGMADGVWLATGRTSDKAATLLYDCEMTDDAVIATVKSFGVPDFAEGEYSPDDRDGEYRYALNLELCLTNGKVVNYDFDVTEQVRRQPRGGVLQVGGIVVSAAEASESGSGFDVDVVDWGPDQPLPMF